MSRDEHFLARWARRKAGIAQAETTEPAPAPAAAVSQDAEKARDEEPFDLSALPALEDITAHTDIRPFMHRLVPADLRNAALRRMWEADAAIRDYVSPATEYAWDFNTPGGAPGYGPLEAGFEAAKTAARMFSGTIENTTLVADGLPAPPASALAPANQTPAAPPSRDAAQNRGVELQTVRLSTKFDEPPPANDAADASLEVEKREISSAPQHIRLRHGGASPR